MKYIVIIGDGMADFPLEELGGRTPLMAARKPNIDRIAREGFCGQVVTVPPGFSPGSDIACMSLFGYDPAHHYTGRAPLEAYGMGVPMDDGDVAFRCNLVYLEVRVPRVFMGDYSAGHISTEEATILVDELRDAIGSDEFRFFTGIAYRHLMLWKGGPTDLVTTPPHDILDREVIDYMPTGEGSRRIVKLMTDSQIFLKDHRINRERMSRGLAPANSIWLWGQGIKPVFRPFRDIHGVGGAVVAAVDLIKGIGALAGFETPRVEGATGYLDTDYGAKARKALELLDGHDIVYVHVEAPDEASHGGNLKEKIEAIERIDEEVVGHLLDKTGSDVRLLVVTDHATPISMRTHHACPVPFAIFQKGRTWESGGTFDEENGGRVFTGAEMIAFFLEDRKV
jgi:2,3-bisphosphoglycerate-independent phosphoglycerate mutase